MYLKLITFPERKRKGPKPVPLADRFWKKVEKTESCWPWIGYRNKDGYGMLRVDGKETGTHRIAWVLANGSIPDGLCVCHHCDNPSCVRPDHLFLGTPADNARDRDEKGRRRAPIGELNPSAKLTAEQVLAIREQYAAGGTSVRKLAAKYGITRGNIQFILHRKNWKVVGAE